MWQLDVLCLHIVKMMHNFHPSNLKNLKMYITMMKGDFFYTLHTYQFTANN